MAFEVMEEFSDISVEERFSVCVKGFATLVPLKEVGRGQEMVSLCVMESGWGMSFRNEGRNQPQKSFAGKKKNIKKINKTNKTRTMGRLGY